MKKCMCSWIFFSWVTGVSRHHEVPNSGSPIQTPRTSIEAPWNPLNIISGPLKPPQNLFKPSETPRTTFQAPWNAPNINRGPPKHRKQQVLELWWQNPILYILPVPFFVLHTAKVDELGVLYIYIYVIVNLWNQIFPGTHNPLREFGESLKCIEIPRNLWNLLT